MKAIFLILLIALVSCEEVEDPVLQAQTNNILKCVLGADAVWKTLSKIVTAIQNKEYSSLLGIVLAAYPEIVSEIKQCLAVNEDDVVLTLPNIVIKISDMKGACIINWFNFGGFAYLKKKCFEHFGSTWYCNAIPA